MASISFWETVCMPLCQKTAQLLSNKQEALLQIKWTDGEANTDSGFSSLACACAKEAWLSIRGLFPDCSDISVDCKSPDIGLTFSKGETIVTGKIELKSGKGAGCIPGSTIGNLDINEPVIFCLRNEGRFEFRYGQYHSCMGETDRDKFQDRTPRPFVNFQKMSDISVPIKYIKKEKGDWINHYAKCALLRTKVLSKQGRSWQDDLVQRLLNLFIKETSVEEFIRLKSGL